MSFYYNNMATYRKTITKFFSIRHSYNSHLLYSISRIFNKNFDIWCQQISTIILINHSVGVDFIHFLNSTKHSFTFKIYLIMSGIMKLWFSICYKKSKSSKFIIFWPWKFWYKYFHIWRHRSRFLSRVFWNILMYFAVVVKFYQRSIHFYRHIR